MRKGVCVCHATDRCPVHEQLDTANVRDGHPALGYVVAALCTQHVHGVVDGLDLEHLDVPVVQILCDRLQHT